MTAIAGLGRKVIVGVVVASVAALTSCQQTASPGPPDQACVTDSVGSLRLISSVPDCSAHGSVCRIKCFAGDAASCLGLGYAANKDSRAAGDAARFYRRACLLGEANACTNYAATLWSGDHSDDQLACAQRTFEKACSAKEHFACGMLGRVMLESTTSPQYEEGRRYLEGACEELSGFPCRVLAKHLETGKLGEYSPERIRDLLARACDGGDPDACGEPATAAETFH